MDSERRTAAIRAAFLALYGARDRRILKMLRSGMSQAEVARKQGVSRQRIHQILKRAEQEKQQ